MAGNAIMHTSDPFKSVTAPDLLFKGAQAGRWARRGFARPALACRIGMSKNGRGSHKGTKALRGIGTQGIERQSRIIAVTTGEWKMEDRKLANPTESDQSIADCGLRIADWLKPVRNLRPKLRIDVFGVGLIHAASIGG